MPTDDHTLVQRARSGDERAFRTLVERYQKKVYAVALGMVKDREEAMDVVQEAFVKVHRSLDSFKADATFYTWLYRITVNVCIDVIRRRGAMRSDSVEFDERVGHDLAEANLGAVSSQLGSNPEKSVLQRELGAEDPGGAGADSREASRNPLAPGAGWAELRGTGASPRDS